MAENTPPQNSNQQLEAGTYEIIQGRLQKQASELRQRLTTLNESRKEVFGAIETALIANDHIATDNNCVAREIVSIDQTNICIFGYNVHIGLRKQLQVKDVFSVYEFRDQSFHQLPLDLIADKRFEGDFHNLYKYYRNTIFAKFFAKGNLLYMVFQTGKTAVDVKAFKWEFEEGKLKYIDDRSAPEIQLPTQHAFEWQRVHRDSHRLGEHSHVSILDRVFVETIGGDLTIKIEDNTDDGKGIYSEDVFEKGQTLDDGEYFYADLGNLVALKIRPYREDARYFVYNEKVKEVKRIDSLEDAAILLPESHGIIFPDGYYLQTGEFKRFDKILRGMQYEKRVISPNGEDYLYVFYHTELDEYILMPYNIIQQKVENPIPCNGYTLFPNGELCYFRAENEPTKHHVLQIWQTPYSRSLATNVGDKADTYLYKVGNKDIVRAMSECYEVLTLLNKEDSYENLYLDLVRKTTEIMDAYYWIGKAETADLAHPLKEIKGAATSAIEEFEKVQRIRRNTETAVQATDQKAEALFTQLKRTRFGTVDIYVKALADFRALRGEVISLKELRYVDMDWIEALEEKVAKETDRLSNACVQFLLREDALEPYHQKVEDRQTDIEAIETAMQAADLQEKIDGIGKELELLIDIVSNLKIEDATHTTQIIDSISDIFVSLNQLKAKVKNRKKELLSVEAVAEFNAQLKLLDQSIINYLDLCSTPNKCDEYLTKLMVQAEELEGKFVDFDEFTTKIYDKREEVNNAFEAKKLQLTEARNRRAASLQSAANRIFKGIRNRLKNFKEVQEINGYFAADLMVDKVRDIVKQLLVLEDSVKADDLQSQLKTLKEEGIRQLKDRKELFVDGENIIKFGRHHFSVNTQPLDLTIVRREGALYFHLTGTNFFEKIDNPKLLATKEVWEQDLISENEEVYRGEYLAWLMFKELVTSEE